MSKSRSIIDQSHEAERNRYEMLPFLKDIHWRSKIVTLRESPLEIE